MIMGYYKNLIRLNRMQPFITLLFVIIGLNGIGQTIKADSSRFPIGSQLKLTIEIPFNNGEQVKWPQFHDTLTKSIEILSKSQIDTITLEGTNEKILRQVLNITSFDTGFIVIPPLNFEISRLGNSPGIVATEPILLQVDKPKIDPAADIKDIKPIYKAPITFRELLPWIALLLAVGLITYIILYFQKKRIKQPTIQPVPKIKVPAWEIALKKLNVLKSEQLWQKGNIKEYYTQLTDILREYFELRYNINAAEMTSSEIQEAIFPHVNDEKVMILLQNVLFLADLAKFAKAQPGTYENEQSILYSFEIVNSTKPIIAEAEKKIEKKPA